MHAFNLLSLKNYTFHLAHSLHFKETAFFDIKKEIEIDLAVEENIMPMCGIQFIYGLRILPKRK